MAFDYSLISLQDELLSVGAIGSFDLAHRTRHHPLHTGIDTFFAQQIDDLLAALITKQLAFVLLMPSDAVTIHQVNEVLGRETRQRRFTKVGIRGDEVLCLHDAVREVTSTATRDTNFFCEFFGVIKQYNALAALARHGRAHHARGTRTDYRDIKYRHAANLKALCTEALFLNQTINVEALLTVSVGLFTQAVDVGLKTREFLIE
jgi:hypothetical protein